MSVKGLRNLYQPIQPAVKQSAADEVFYQEYLPDLRLQQLIYCFWELKTERPLQADFCYRVVADGCMDLLMEMNNPSASYITGLATSYIEFPIGPYFHYVGIRFLPGGFPRFFGVDASTLTNRFEDLKAVVPELSDFLTGRFVEAQKDSTLKETLDQYFLERLVATPLQEDHRVLEAMKLILEQKGQVPLAELNTGLSPRQLRRRFHFYLGDSAKTFSKVVRFQQFLQAKPSRQALKQDKLFYDVGYYDQAHFIKEFKHFYGLTPNKALD
ncbi:MAG: helix-turn-helix domain-containing protein [Saprospiraceae bacterium]|nr:helix-turn-helix domain-containing protein [Saprospiraceae bacterium]